MERGRLGEVRFERSSWLSVAVRLASPPPQTTPGVEFGGGERRPNAPATARVGNNVSGKTYLSAKNSSNLSR